MIRWIAAGMSGALIAGAAWLVTTREPVDDDLAHARAACESSRRLEQQVTANAPAEDVLQTLERASASAEAATDANARWLPLWSGFEALRIAFAEDDAQAARAGIDVVRAECSRAHR